MIQIIQLQSLPPHPLPPNPNPLPLPPQQQRSNMIIIIQENPPSPHPQLFPQFVAAKSLIVVPPNNIYIVSYAQQLD